ncbi:MAG: heme A synthase [Alphaproteobacteria bacterium]|nr:heme A synthase [Alphaproteobacteria bacterium]
MRPGGDRAVAAWLFVCAALVAAMVVFGGLTRLTESGLSIVEWRPITGALPPLTAAAWDAEFAKYRESPEYKHVNLGMSMAGFQRIYLVEWGHRLLGRLIGLVVLVPLIWWWWRGRIDRALGLRVLALSVLGGLQGAMGWYMVASGLVSNPAVSHYRLAAHLALALVIFAGLWWLALDAGEGRKAERDGKAALVAGLIFLQSLSGALVAGLDAGMAANTWPRMGDGLVPANWNELEPWWLNWLENPSTVQFSHRSSAWLAAAAAVWLWWHMRDRRGADWLPILVVVQFALGVATVLSQVAIPIAALHQAVAVALFALAVTLARKPAA